MIKAIIFDFFGVVSSNEYWREIKHDKRVGKVFGELAHEVNLGNLHWRDFVKQLAKHIGEDPKKMEKLYEAASLDPQIIVFIAELRKQFTTVLLTNAHHEFLDPIVKRAHLDEVFDHIIVSSQLGLPKPDPRIFEYTIKQLEMKPEDTVLIDDGDSNVASAELVGMKAILFENFNQMRDDLEKVTGVVMPR